MDPNDPYPKGAKVLVNAPGDPKYDEGWHRGIVVGTAQGEHALMVTVRFDNGDEQAFAHPYVDFEQTP